MIRKKCELLYSTLVSNVHVSDSQYNKNLQSMTVYLDFINNEGKDFVLIVR